MTKAEPFTWIVVFDIGGGGGGGACGSPIGISKRGDPQRVPLLPFYCASTWHKNVP